MTDFRNQRRSPRCSFVLTAEVVDENSRTLIARLRNLNSYGCYLEMGNLLAAQSSITIKVIAGKPFFRHAAESFIPTVTTVRVLNSRALLSPTEKF